MATWQHRDQLDGSGGFLRWSSLPRCNESVGQLRKLAEVTGFIHLKAVKKTKTSEKPPVKPPVFIHTVSASFSSSIFSGRTPQLETKL